MSTLFRLAKISCLLIPASILTAAGASAQEATCNLVRAAADVREKPRQAVTIFRNMRGNKCFLIDNLFGQRCKTSELTDPVCDIVGEWSDEKAQSTSAAELYDILTSIKTTAEGLDRTADPVLKFLESVEGMEPDLGEDAVQFARDQDNTARWDEALGKLPGLGIDPEIELNSQDSPCTQRVDHDRCVAAFKTLVHVYILARLQKTVFSALLAEDRAAVENYITTVDGRWKSYLNDSRGILPWELVLNGFFFKPERGFNEPPNGQLIALHPSTGVAIGDRDDDDLEPIITLELIGYYGWRWEGQEMKAPVPLPGFLDDSPWGASLLLAFDGDNDPGFGGTLHLPRNWSVGAVVDTDGDITGLVSVDLAKLEFFSGSKDSIKDGLLTLFKK